MNESCKLALNLGVFFTERPWLNYVICLPQSFVKWESQYFIQRVSVRILKRQQTYKVIKTMSCTEAFNKSVIISAGPPYLQVPHPPTEPNETIWGEKNSRKKVPKTKI